MPFLPLEPFLYPENLFDGNAERNEHERWWVLYTRPRAEKALARRLHGRGVSFFLPLYKRQHRSSGRLFTGYHPLFTGYLFLLGDDDARIHALETNLVSRNIPVTDQTRFEEDIRRVYQLIESGFALAPEERLQPGTVVEIVSGPLAGVQGKVLSAGKKQRLVVEVRFLQCGVSVELDGWMIRPATK